MLSISDRYNKVEFIVALTLVVIMLGLFIYPCFLAFPHGDDLNRVDAWKYPFTAHYYWYIGHNGRYFNSITAFLPVYSPVLVYRLAIASLFFIGWVVFNKVFRCFFDCNALPVKILSFAVFGVWYAFLPAPNQFIYWYATGSAYFLGFMFFLLFSIHYLKYFTVENKSLSLAYLFAFAGIGSHEIIMMNTLIFCGFGIIYSFYEHREKLLSLIKHFLFTVFCFCLVFFSPGTRKRADKMDSGNQIFESILTAFEVTMEFLIRQLNFKTALIFICILGLALAIPLKKRYSSKIIIYANLICMAMIYGSILVPTQAIKNFIYKNGRVENLIESYFFLWIAVNIWLVLKHFEIEKKISPRGFYIVAAMAILFLFKGSNLNLVLSEIKSDTLLEFHKNSKSRIEYAKCFTPSDTIVIPAHLVKSKLIYFKDIGHQGGRAWFNEGFKNHYGNIDVLCQLNKRKENHKLPMMWDIVNFETKHKNQDWAIIGDSVIVHNITKLVSNKTPSIIARYKTANKQQRRKINLTKKNPHRFDLNKRSYLIFKNANGISNYKYKIEK